MSAFKNKAVFDLRKKALGGAPDARLASDKLTPFSLSHPRLLNAFSIGCDPEFVFEQKCETRDEWEPSKIRTHYKVVGATDCNLRLDEAFGADGGGTPVELRAHPSKFALEVVGSILNTLRWLYLSNSKARNCDSWSAGSYVQKVSLGGHVHLGRRAGKRPEELEALHSLCRALEIAGFFVGSDNRRTYSIYGKLDKTALREQAWGYEYRAFGCWLFSPAIAHFLLTMTKLAVLDPEIGKVLSRGEGLPKYSKPEIYQLLENILRFYRYLDDDASIAFGGLKRTLATTLNPNIKKAWGLVGPVFAESLDQVPSTIPADAPALGEVLDAINGKELDFRTPPKTWVRAVSEPFDRKLAFKLTPEADEINLGEAALLENLFGVKGSAIEVNACRGSFYDKELSLSPRLTTLLSNSEYAQLKNLCQSIDSRIIQRTPTKSMLELSISRTMRENAPLRAIKRFLEGSGVLPLGNAATMTPEFCLSWQKRLKKAGCFVE